MAALTTPTEIGAQEHAGSEAGLTQALSGPLDSILAMAELLDRQSLGVAAKAQLAALLDAGRRMARMLNDVAETWDLQTPPAFEPHLLRDITDDLEARWGAEGAGQDVRLLISCSASADLRIMVDAPRLRRLTNALIEDALANSRRGVIELQFSALIGADGAVTIQGVLQAPTASEPLSRVKFDACRAIAMQLGGDLRCAGNPGEGFKTTFELRLLKAGADLPQAEAAAEDAGPLPARTHLLIVDDNATNRIVAAALCEMFGCTAEVVEDGVEAVEAARSRPFDLILMDIKMPRMDGLEATRVIRALPGAAGTLPIIALTANADPDAVATYLAAGMQGVVDKPIKPDQLLSTLQWALCDPEAIAARRSSAA